MTFHYARSVRLVLVLTVLLTACGADPLPGTDLPPAVTADPDTAAPGTGGYSIAFTTEFPAGFWDLGTHRYSFFVNCAALGGGGPQPERAFEVTELSRAIDEPVYLRIVGLSTGIVDPPNVVNIHPDQATIAAITFVGVSQEAANTAYNECEGGFIYDEGATATLTPLEPFVR